LYINKATDYAGLFGFIDSGVSVSNVHLLNVSISGVQYAGGLTGKSQGSIYNCSSEGNVSCSGFNFCGGLVGSSTSSTIINMSYAKGTVSGKYRTGGLAGVMNGIVENSYSQSTVFCSVSYCGGFIGQITDTDIINCYGANNFTTGQAITGAFVGYCTGSNSLSNSYYDTQVTTGDNSNCANGIQKTTSNMQDISTFSAWDIADIGSYSSEVWYIDDGNDYPRLNLFIAPDITQIDIQVTYPENNGRYRENLTEMNYTIFEIATADTCWYSLDGGITNTTITCGNNVTGLNIGEEQEHTWTVYANDSEGNIFSNSTTFVIDKTTPYLTWYDPSTTSYTNLSSYTINVSVTDPYLDATNITVYNDNSILYTNFTGDLTSETLWLNDDVTIAEGINILEICARDSLESSPKIRDLTHLEKSFSDEDEYFDITKDGVTVRRTTYVINNGGNKVNRQDWNLDIIDEWIDGGRHLKATINSDKLQNENWAIRVDIECIEGCNFMELKTDRGIDRIIDDERTFYFNYDDAIEEGWDIQYVEENGIVSVIIAYPDIDFYNLIEGTQSIDPIVAGLNTVCENKTIVMDTISPIIDYDTGTEEDDTIFFSRNYVYVDVSVTELNEDTIIFYIFDEEDNLISMDSFTDGTRDMTWNFLPDGTYKYYVYVDDKVGNFAQTSQRTITIFNNAQDDYPSFEGEIIYTGSKREIYDIMRYSGAGLSLLFSYLASSLPVLLVGVGFVLIIIAVSVGFKNIFEVYQSEKSK
jgi:hypothetical protein